MSIIKVKVTLEIEFDYPDDDEEALKDPNINLKCAEMNAASMVAKAHSHLLYSRFLHGSQAPDPDPKIEAELEAGRKFCDERLVEHIAIMEKAIDGMTVKGVVVPGTTTVPDTTS